MAPDIMSAACRLLKSFDDFDSSIKMSVVGHGANFYIFKKRVHGLDAGGSLVEKRWQ